MTRQLAVTQSTTRPVARSVSPSAEDPPVVSTPQPAAEDSRSRIRDEERRRLLFELHDGMGPTLAAVALGLRAARHAMELNPVVAAKLLGEIEHDVQRGITELRRLTGGQRASDLDALGLLTALRRQVAILSTRMAEGIDIGLDLPDSLPPLGTALEHAAYRIACEALTNMARHAAARTCQVRLHLDAHHLHLAVVDDGAGVLAADAIGVGLRSMRERARELGGDCLIETVAAGRGTRVAVRLPLRAKGD